MKIFHKHPDITLARCYSFSRDYDALYSYQYKVKKITSIGIDSVTDYTANKTNLRCITFLLYYEPFDTALIRIKYLQYNIIFFARNTFIDNTFSTLTITANNSIGNNIYYSSNEWKFDNSSIGFKKIFCTKFDKHDYYIL